MTFEELPLELQEQIIRSQPESARTLARTLSRLRSFHEASQNVLCRHLPTRSEMRRYLEAAPSLLGAFWLHNTQSYIYHRLVEIYLREPFYLDLRTCQIFPNDDLFGHLATQYGEIYMPQAEPNQDFTTTEITISSDELLSREQIVPEIQKFFIFQPPSPRSPRDKPPGRAYTELPTILKEPQLDLLSTYRILSQRQSCITRQSDYAKAVVLQYVDIVTSAYSQNRNIISLLATHAWLSLQGRILNIYPPPPIHSLVDWIFTRAGDPIYVPYETDTEEEAEEEKNGMRALLDTMRREIDTMYQQVRRVLDRLD
jgi:hypothetical protein